MNVRSVFVWIVKIILIAALIRYLIQGIEWEALFLSIQGYGITALIAGMVLIILNDVVQGWRWRYLSRERCSLKASFESIVIGGFLNVILPAKVGELSRLIYLRNVYGYSINDGIGNMVIERGMDLFIVALFLVAGAGLATENTLIRYISLAVLLMMIGTVFALRAKEGRVVRKILGYIPIRFIRVYAKKIVRKMVKDLEFERLLKAFGYTLMLRSVYFLTVAYFILGLADIELSWSAVFIVYLVSSIAWSIPLAPAGSGTFHAGMVLAMGWYGVSKEESLAVAIVFHLLLNLVPLFMAGFILWGKGIPLTTMVKVEGINRQPMQKEIE